MLQFVGHGIAMGNATEPTKRVAEYVTADIHDDGIYKAMQHFGLISQ
jgi:hydroxymethylpyrimidine pyrophosphatase-like HAD family hydrolase